MSHNICKFLTTDMHSLFLNVIIQTNELRRNLTKTQIKSAPFIKLYSFETPYKISSWIGFETRTFASLIYMGGKNPCELQCTYLTARYISKSQGIYHEKKPSRFRIKTICQEHIYNS